MVILIILTLFISLNLTINYSSGLDVPVNQADKIKSVMNLTEHRHSLQIIFLPEKT